MTCLTHAPYSPTVLGVQILRQLSSSIRAWDKTIKRPRLPTTTADTAHSTHIASLISLPLVPSHLSEKFVRGSGGGGQKVNKSNNCVVLTHVPTGILVKVHETRSLAQNRVIARKRLTERLRLVLEGRERKEQEEVRRRKAEKGKERRRKKYKELDAIRKSAVSGGAGFAGGARGESGGRDEISDDVFDDMVDEEDF